MKIIFVVWLFNLSCYFGFIQSSKCPTFCNCYKWQQHLRIDCVRRGLIDVNIGLDNGDGGKGVLAGLIYPVQVLDLSYNSISSLKGGVFNSHSFVQLECLHLSHNSIAHVSASALQGLGHLKILDLSYNRLRRNHGVLSVSIPSHILPAQLFKDSPNLRALRLGSNPLENEDFHGKSSNEDGEPFLIAPRLEYLDLGSCHLGHVGPKSFDGLESMKALNLSDNQLISLNPIAFENMTNLVELLLYANPWPCDQTNEMEILENWLSRKKFTPACRKEMFEKMIVSNPKDTGPQRAEDDRSLLYYYLKLGIIIEEQGPILKIEHPHIDISDDVEVFDKKALDPRFKPFEHISDLDLNLTEESISMNKVHCSFDGIQVFWFIILSFMAGALMSFLCTFQYFAKPCGNGGCCSSFFRMVRQSSSSESRRRYLNRIKTLSRIENSMGESSSSRTNMEMYSLIDSSVDDIHALCLPTPVMPRASAQRIETPPPTYEEHLIWHPIGTNSH